jgi:hypothetical protein
MPSYGFAVPILPGKEPMVRQLSAEMKQRQPEYEESRRRAGVSVERSFLQTNPDGSSLVVVYVEGQRGFNEGMRILVSSNSPFDRHFFEVNQEATGIDFAAGLQGPEPELMGQWMAPGASRRGRGFAFAAPLRPGMTEAGKRFAQEAYAARQSELTESRLAEKLAREEVFLNQTPMGDIVVVYLEGDDPAGSNRLFAASNRPFDRWFKDQCREIFPEGIDFDEPVPQNEELVSWVNGA